MPTLPRVRDYWDQQYAPHVVYEFYDREGAPVYVGCTINLADRLRTHQGSEMWREVVEVHTRLHPTRDEARSAEKSLIRELQPRWNFQSTERASEAAREQHRRRRGTRHAAS
jgi:excinuclease UvrABC nuclease subunit